MNSEHQIIQGKLFTDERGSLAYNNDFLLNSIVRFYEIAPIDTTIIRAWQAHKKESKWFYCTHGAFKINLIKLDSFENPSNNLEVFSFELNADNPQVLYVPGGYANGFKAMIDGSKLMVFSNFNLKESNLDNYRFDVNKWIINW